MIYIQLIFNFMLIIGLLLAVVSGVAMWLVSRQLAKMLKANLQEYYTESFLENKNIYKYRNLNKDLQQLINDSEKLSTDEFKQKVEEVRKKHRLKPSFDEFFIAVVEDYKKKILLWKKVGNIAVGLTVIGALGSIPFLVFKD